MVYQQQNQIVFLQMLITQVGLKEEIAVTLWHNTRSNVEITKP